MSILAVLNKQTNKAMKNVTTIFENDLTDLETQVLIELVTQVRDWIGCEQYSPADTDTLSKATGLNVSTIKGVLGSLVKKGLVWTLNEYDETQVGLAEQDLFAPISNYGWEKFLTETNQRVEISRLTTTEFQNKLFTLDAELRALVKDEKFALRKAKEDSTNFDLWKQTLQISVRIDEIKLEIDNL